MTPDVEAIRQRAVELIDRALDLGERIAAGLEPVPAEFTGPDDYAALIGRKAAYQAEGFAKIGLFSLDQDRDRLDNWGRRAAILQKNL